MPHAEKPHILIVDDDPEIRKLIARFLVREGMIAMTAEHAEAARDILRLFAFDLLVVDRMMPGQDGAAFVQDLRKAQVETPAILLTALAAPDERIEGLEQGADDYLSKPFEPRELVLRIHAILKRVPRKEEPVIADEIILGNWRYKSAFAELQHVETGATQRLTETENTLLQRLARTPNVIVSRDALADGNADMLSERAVDVQVTRLRRKLEDNPKTPRCLQTVRGKGYLLRVVESK